MVKKQSTDCPCGSGRGYDECCGHYIAGAGRAPTAEALMRSRYSAYVRADEAYLLKTWHASTRPTEVTFDGGRTTRWLGLKIVASEAGGEQDDEGMVEFIARFKSGGSRAERMHERSQFRREGGEWYYVDGRQL